jgi:hypothetical protein
VAERLAASEEGLSSMKLVLPARSVCCGDAVASAAVNDVDGYIIIQ